MIDLYTWTTPNGRKASIALEELGLPYTTHPIDIGKDEQFKPEFLRISPNNRIPAMVDRENGISLMESGAILIYLADMTGKLLPKSGEGHYRVLEWLMWQMGGPGPMLGQVHHFVKYNKGKAPYAEERYLKEAHRLYGVLDCRLAQHGSQKQKTGGRQPSPCVGCLKSQEADMKCSCMTLFRALFPTILVSTIAQPQLLLANPLSPPSGSYEITARLELPYLDDGAWIREDAISSWARVILAMDWTVLIRCLTRAKPALR